LARIVNEHSFHGLADNDRLRRITASYGVIVGVMMIAQWTGFIIMGEVGELESEPIRIAFHLAAELSTAMAPIIGSVGLVKRLNWGYPAFLVSQGMLAYTIIISPGYFAQDGELLFVGMFAVLWVMTIAVVVTAVKNEAALRGGMQTNDSVNEED
jgi:peptidoglycan/LPS O-acetylase OafA/YrhL